MILHHRSPRRNRLAISRWGLIPRATCDHHYPAMTYQPVGVFATPADSQPWYCSNWPRGEDIDRWEIDATGLEMIPDPELGWCDGKVIIERVPPERLRRVEP